DAPPPAPLASVSDGGVEAPTSSNGRDGAGRFAPGNTHGRGNPFARRMAAMRSAVLEVTGEEEGRELFRELHRRAMGGDAQAAALVLAYAVGKPAKAVDPDRVDLDEWKLLDASPDAVTVLRAMLNAVPVPQARDLVERALADPESVRTRIY